MLAAKTSSLRSVYAAQSLLVLEDHLLSCSCHLLSALVLESESKALLNVAVVEPSFASDSGECCSCTRSPATLLHVLEGEDLFQKSFKLH